jgi:hypothetical protein
LSCGNSLLARGRQLLPQLVNGRQQRLLTRRPPVPQVQHHFNRAQAQAHLFAQTANAGDPLNVSPVVANGTAGPTRLGNFGA